MKVIIFFLILMPSLSYSNKNNNIVMLKVIYKSKIKKIDIEMLNSSIEMNLTRLNYGIISQDIQEEALKEQQEQRKSDCYDDSCLVDTGRMLAARELLVLNIKKRKKDYFIKARRIDIETGVVKKSDIAIIKKKYNEEVAHKKLTEMINILFNENYKSQNGSSGNNLLIKEGDIINLDIETNPSNAIITLNEKKVGESPFNEKILKGKLKLEIRKEFYEVVKETIDTSKKTNFDYELKLKPEYRIINIITNKKAEIKINGIIYNKKSNNIFKKGKQKIEIEIKDKSKKKFYKKIEEIIDISEKSSFDYKLELKENYTFLNLKTNQEKALIKLNEEVLKGSDIKNKIVEKSIYKLKITKKHYKTIETEINTRNKTSFNYNLVPIIYIKNIVSSGKNVEVYDEDGKRYKTPFKVKLVVAKPKKFIFKKNGYRNQEVSVDIASENTQSISIQKLRVHNLTINNNIGLENASIRGKNKNGKVDIKLSKGINKLKLYEGEYRISGDKEYYESYYKHITIEKESSIKSLKINPERYYNYEFDSNIKFITEYNFSDLIKNNTSIGFIFESYNERSSKEGEGLLTLGLLADIENKSLVVKLALYKLRLYSKASPIFIQLGFFGLGDEVDLMFREDELYVSGVLSFRIGGDIYLNYPSLKLRLSARASSISKGLEEDAESDFILTTGVSLIWGQKKD